MSMSVEALQIFVNLMVAIFCIGAIPFAGYMVVKIASIEATLKGMRWQEEAIETLRKGLQEQRLICARRHGSNPADKG